MVATAGTSTGIDYRRILPAMDVPRLNASHVVVFGVGGAANLAMQLVRSGVKRFTLIDIDRVESLNLTRQAYTAADVGEWKVAALKRRLESIDPGTQVTTWSDDFTKVPFAEAVKRTSEGDLIISATDRFAVQAFTNRLVLQQQVPAVWPGIGRNATGGEVVWWKPGLPCHRCLLASRYARQEEAAKKGETLDPQSDGSTCLEGGFVDTIASMIAIGLLTEGAENRYGRLIANLGRRNFLRIKIASEHTFNGEDVVGSDLGIDPKNRRFFGWAVSALEDPDDGNLPCPDCDRVGAKWLPEDGMLHGMTVESLRKLRPFPHDYHPPLL